MQLRAFLAGCSFGSMAMIGNAAGLDATSHVFVILMENHNWVDIKGSASAPYINNTLLPMASYCDQYYNPPGLHPSEPNYLSLDKDRRTQSDSPAQVPTQRAGPAITSPITARQMDYRVSSQLEIPRR